MMATAAPEQRIDQLMALGLTAEVAEQLATAYNDTMGRCILALYRSAAQPVMAELGRKLSAAAQRPGLAVLATEDHYVGTDQMRRRAAERAGARIEVLEGLGHWWMVQDPARGADVLTRFWAWLPG
jgi:pimeloyl-ACP methyl ester carboxylesterase